MAVGRSSKFKVTVDYICSKGRRASRDKYATKNYLLAKPKAETKSVHVHAQTNHPTPNHEPIQQPKSQEGKHWIRNNIELTKTTDIATATRI